MNKIDAVLDGSGRCCTCASFCGYDADVASTEEWKQWEQESLRLLAAGVRAAREDRGLSQAELAKRAGVSKGLVMNIEASTGENPRLQALPSIATLVRIALALGRPPVELMYPTLPDGVVEVWPGAKTSCFIAAQWFSGEISASDIDDSEVNRKSSNARIQQSRLRARLRENVRVARRNYLDARVVPHSSIMTEDQAAQALTDAQARLDDQQSRMRAQGLTVTDG